MRAVPFFFDADPDFVTAIITKLEFEVYLEGDVIIREGELGTEMYFLKSGVVSVSCDGQTTDDLTDGSYFGGEFSIGLRVGYIYSRFSFNGYLCLCLRKRWLYVLSCFFSLFCLRNLSVD